MTKWKRRVRPKRPSRQERRRQYWKRRKAAWKRLACGKEAAHLQNNVGDSIEYCCHTFKADSPSSRLTRKVRSIAIQTANEKSTIKASRFNLLRVEKKNGKLKTLLQLDPKRTGKSKRIERSFLERNLIFFSGTNERQVPGVPPKYAADCQVLAALKDLVLLDNPKGLYMPRVFTLIPRDELKEVYNKHSLARVYDALSYCESLKPKPTQRASGKRIVCRETKDDSRYVTFGTYVFLTNQGLGQTMKGLDTHRAHHKAVGNFIKTVEQVGAAYMNTKSLFAMKAIRDCCTYSGVDCGDGAGTRSKIWPSVSFGRNVFLSTHIDEDFFLSVTAVVAKEQEMDAKGQLKLDSSICNCFCFPEQGVCVALRNGDILLFNPLVYHCVSSRCDPQQQVFCLSMYLKTAVVGGNDNGTETKGLKRRKKANNTAGGN